MFFIAPSLAVVGSDPEFLDVQLDGLSKKFVVAPGGSSIHGAFEVDLAATAFVRVRVTLEAEHEHRSVHGYIEDTVDIVLVPDFKERFCLPGDPGDLPGR